MTDDNEFNFTVYSSSDYVYYIQSDEKPSLFVYAPNYFHFRSVRKLQSKSNGSKGPG